MRGRLALLAIGMVVASALVVLLAQFGVPGEFTLAWMLILIAVTAAGRQVFIDDRFSWPPEETRRAGRGSDVSRLAWAINVRTGVAGHVVVRRVQAVLRRRLAHHGLDLDDPAQYAVIDAMLGEGVRAGLQRREVQRTDIERVLDAIDRIPTDALSTDTVPTPLEDDR